MRQFLSTISLVFLSLSSTNASGFGQKKMKNLVTFGASYSDVHSNATVEGGLIWPLNAANYAQVSLYPYAQAPAMCSNKLVPGPGDLRTAMASLVENQLPLYFTGRHNGSLKLSPEETVYNLWLGMNDIGEKGFLTGSGNSTIVDVTSCLVGWVKELYKDGARNFIFQNMIPLQNTVQYSLNSYPNPYWTRPRNITEWNVIIPQFVQSGNALMKLMLQDLAPTLPGAQIALFDSHSLFDDMYHQPALYLNGTVPFNVTGAIKSCIFDEGQLPSDPPAGGCTYVSGSAADSYLWYDELHPSPQAHRIVAREIANIVQGRTSKWAIWL